MKKRLPNAILVHRKSLLYQAVYRSIRSLLLNSQLKNGHILYLVDRFIQILLSWLSEAGVFNPRMKMVSQQKRIISYVMSASPLPNFQVSLQILRQHLSHILQVQSLNRYEQNVRNKMNKEKKEMKEKKENILKRNERCITVPPLSPKDDLSLPSIPPNDNDDNCSLYDTNSHDSYEIPIPEEERMDYFPGGNEDEDQVHPNHHEQIQGQAQQFTLDEEQTPIPTSLQNAHGCLVCGFFNFQHPSDLCQWSLSRQGRRRSSPKIPYKPKEKKEMKEKKEKIVKKNERCITVPPLSPKDDLSLPSIPPNDNDDNCSHYDTNSHDSHEKPIPEEERMDYFPGGNEDEDQEQIQGQAQQFTIDEEQTPIPTSLQNAHGCLICGFFNFQHPTDLCQWSLSRHGCCRPPPKIPYNPYEAPFQFCMDDIIKMNSEDPDITKKYNKEDKSLSDYSVSSTSTSSTIKSNLSFVSASGKKKTIKRPTFSDYERRFGISYAEEWQAYNDWRNNVLPKEETGTVRPLLPPEIRYFNFAKNSYQCIPAIRTRPHKYSNPPRIWQKRRDTLSLVRPSILEFETIIDSLYQFSTLDCKESAESERNRWEEVLQSFSIGSLERVLWAVAFLKSTNGVADKVSCGHFRKIISKSPPLSLDLHKDPYAIASLLRQTSKWVKNSFVIINIFKHIQEQWNGVPSDDLHDWLKFYEIGPKTASLILHAAFNKSTALPVDSHVWYAFRKWKWTNAKTPDECSWQASSWIPSNYYIKTNDVIGSLRQALADPKTRHKVLKKANCLPPTIACLVNALL
jgi:endonuclease III